jgi:pimeloyl-ACP methyl ester carboxylesterase
MKDMFQFLSALPEKKYSVFGHSLGGHIALRLALETPKKIKKLVLLDPIIFPKWMIFLWKFIQWTEFGESHHPMIKACKNQRLIHNSRIELKNRYRKKKIFNKISDENLSFLIDGLVKDRDENKIEIRFPKDWEIQIYRTGMTADIKIWKKINLLNKQVLILHAEKTHAPTKSVINTLSSKSNMIKAELLVGLSHFFPFEEPKQIGKKIINFLQ